MKAKSFLPTTIVISLLLFQLTFAAPPRYEIIDLGTLGGIHSVGRSINDKGQVVGYSENSLGLERATLFDSTGNGNNIDLGTLDGQYSKANSINRDGQIVGQATNASGYWRATLFHPTGEGKNIDLGTLGGDRSYASSINDDGQIVGWAQIASGERHATLFDPTGGRDNIDLGTLGGDESWASSINNSSQIVGTAYRLFTSPGGRFPPVTSSYPRATLFDPTGQGNNIDLGTLLYTYGLCCCSGAMSINDSGHIVGAAWNEDPFPFGQEMAVLFDPTGDENNIFLGTLDRYGSFAYSINNRDQIIGWGGFCSNNLCGTRPALFDHTGQGNNVNLYDLIDPCCCWILKEVWSINDSGWMVGEGINPAGKHHAFLMKPIPPKVIYVDDDAAGANDGSSWADAFNYLQDTLAAAWDGDEIRVAEGIYKTDQGAVVTIGDRTTTFQLINGVTIKGGYAGFNHPDPNARDVDLYETILSGDLVGDDGPALFEDFMMCCTGFNEPLIPFLKANNYSENSYHVVTGNGTDETAVMDGLTVTAGNADTYPNDYGGGIYNYCGSPTLKKCKVIANFAGRYGGAMYNEQSSPTLDNCKFYGNSVIGLYDGGGGGMYNHHSNPTMTNCTFEQNWVYVYQWELGADGGGMCNVDSSPTLVNSTFRYNSAMESGGMSNYYSDSTLTNCIFNGNTSETHAGGMYNGSSNPTLINCSFIANYADGQGGGMDNHQSSPTLNNCRFIKNLAGRGGGMNNSTNHFECNPVLTDCVFIANTATYEYGGVMYNYAGEYGECSPMLKNCILSGNSAPEKGGGIYNYGRINASLINCTLTGNSANNGNALACDFYQQLYLSNVEISNCIFWDDGNEIWNNNNSVITIRYSDLQGGWPGEGNIEIDPCFAEPGYWIPGYWDPDDDFWVDPCWVDGDYYLLAISPCIDTGDPNYVPEPNETDLDGRPRVINGRIDMGAYEYSPPIQADIRIIPRTINLRSKGQWISAFIWLPEGYSVADVDPNSVLLNNEIEPERFRLSEDNQTAIAKFDREQVQNILSIGDIELTITGQLTDGTVFEGADIIKVTDNAGKKPANGQ